jgi:hypothetical protein
MARPVAELQRFAVARALAAGLHRRVVRVRFGVYLVPSTTRNVVHAVSHSPASPEHLVCSCEARQHPACQHRAAVYLAKLEASGLRVKPSTFAVAAVKKEAA